MFSSAPVLRKQQKIIQNSTCPNQWGTKDIILHIGTIILRFIFIFSSKRGIDFGLGRGFSGSQAAKHFMGMAAARYSGGPGKKKKRSQYWGGKPVLCIK